MVANTAEWPVGTGQRGFQPIPVPPYDPNGPPQPVAPVSDKLPPFASVVPMHTRTPLPNVFEGAGSVKAKDGRNIEIRVDGPGWGIPLVFHNDTPFGALYWQDLADMAKMLGLRLIQIVRPGYSSSSRLAHRRICDSASDVETVLDYLEAEFFITLGWCGGGPYALSSASALADRCHGVSLVGVPAPFDAYGLNWASTMTPSRVILRDAAVGYETQLSTILDDQRNNLLRATPIQLAKALSGTDVGNEDSILTSTAGMPLARSARDGLIHSVAGWYDDTIALFHQWGFAFTQISAPVAIWQANHDLVAPRAHGDWYAAALPQVRHHSVDFSSHVSLFLMHMEEILRDLMTLSHQQISPYFRSS